MRKIRLTGSVVVIFATTAVGVSAQIASGGNFVVTKSVVAGGGSSDLSGGVYSVDGTIGQAVAQNGASSSTVKVSSGFWTGDPAITQPAISVSGRVTTPFDQGLRNVVVTLIDPAGVRRRATSSSFGLYSFDNVSPGETYIITVSSRRYRFEPKILHISESLANVDFRGLE